MTKLVIAAIIDISLILEIGYGVLIIKAQKGCLNALKI
jgi:hypothetical protein